MMNDKDLRECRRQGQTKAHTSDLVTAQALILDKDLSDYRLQDHCSTDLWHLDVLRVRSVHLRLDQGWMGGGGAGSLFLR
jgi:hypothetical protein